MGTTAGIGADAASAVMLPAVVTLQPLDPARLPLFARLWQFYLYEASGRDALDLDADGRFDWDEALFTGIAHGDGGEHDADAWLIECGGQVAGLLVTMQVQLAGAPIREFADLYVLPRFRGRGVASAVIQQVIIEGDLDAWLVAVFRNDPDALAFWQRTFVRLPFAAWRDVEPSELPDFHIFVVGTAASRPR